MYRAVNDSQIQNIRNALGPVVKKDGTMDFFDFVARSRRKQLEEKGLCVSSNSVIKNLFKRDLQRLKEKFKHR